VGGAEALCNDVTWGWGGWVWGFQGGVGVGGWDGMMELGFGSMQGGESRTKRVGDR